MKLNGTSASVMLRVLIFAIASLPGSLLIDLGFHDGASALTWRARHPASTFQLHILAHAAVLAAAMAAGLCVSVAVDQREPRLDSVMAAGLLNGLVAPEVALVTSAACGPLIGFLVLAAFAVLALATVLVLSSGRN